uniref:Uncharacterized protein n=1 Tax=Acrobeloides nanus TaxID=290746 RepID=A0A914DZB6_9BILA
MLLIFILISNCSSDSIDNFNNAKVFPLLSKLLQKDYFKFYKVNMLRPCPYWPDDHQCASKECGIQHCDDEVPLALRKKSSIIPASNEVEVETVSRSGSDCETSNQFDPLDTSLSEYDRAQLRDMDTFEDTSDRFCDVEAMLITNTLK